jgi:hypothetical protein
VTELGWLGVWLLVLGVVLIIVEGALAGIWSARLSKCAQTLNGQLAIERGLLESDLRKLRMMLEETQMLWQPYRRLLRWLRHPLVIALMQSYAKRRLAAR